MNRAILLISCPDQKGITATVTGFIYENNGNILHADQHIDEQSNTFFMRVEWALEGFRLEEVNINQAFEPIAKRYSMAWDLYFTKNKPRVAVFVSRHLHCLRDLLLRYQQAQFHCQIPLIISNHEDAGSLAGQFGIQFNVFPIDATNKHSQEEREIQLLKDQGIDLVVLARYHQVLSKRFIETFPSRIINIHHSFLPAFQGRSPYQQAYRKGVKIIGATSHFVVEQLDEGPIIEQDTIRVSHRDSLEDFVRKGEDLEKAVLSKTLRLALEQKILCYENKTVIFD